MSFNPWETITIPSGILYLGMNPAPSNQDYTPTLYTGLNLITRNNILNPGLYYIKQLSSNSRRI